MNRPYPTRRNHEEIKMANTNSPGNPHGGPTPTEQDKRKSGEHGRGDASTQGSSRDSSQQQADMGSKKPGSQQQSAGGRSGSK
jgi:hypothetical protein